MLAGPVYLDSHATTPVDPRVVQAMSPCWTECFANPGSLHAHGENAKAVVQAARASLAQSLRVQPDEIIFTSGATESNNLALKGLAARLQRRGQHFVTVATEHRAVLDPLGRLQRRGCQLTLLRADEQGRLELAQLARALVPGTLCVSVMLANNEIGLIHPLAEIGKICREKGVLLHCDATQAVGKVPLDLSSLPVDLLSFSAHKMYGPKGIGALFVRSGSGVKLEPQLDGGSQERGFRSGTLAVPLIVGFAKALELCLTEMPVEAPRLAGLRERLWQALTRQLPGVILNGPHWESPGVRLPHNLNVSFADVDGPALLASLKDVSVSSGSACSSGNPEPSHVLKALGRRDELALASLRFGLSRQTTEEEIDFAAERVVRAVRQLRGALCSS